MKMRQKIKNKSQRHKYTKYKMYLSVIMAICIMAIYMWLNS